MRRRVLAGALLLVGYRGVPRGHCVPRLYIAILFLAPRGGLHLARRTGPTTASTPPTRTTRSRGRAAPSPSSTSRGTSRRPSGSPTFRYNRELSARCCPGREQRVHRLDRLPPNVSKLMFTNREHVFRSLNGGVNPNFPYANVKEHCNLWFGDGDIDKNGTVPAGDRRLRRLEGDGRSGPLRPAHLRPGGGLSAGGEPRAARGRSPAPRRTRGATTAPAGTSPSTRRRRPTRTSSGRGRAEAASSSRRTRLPPTRPRSSWRRIDQTSTVDPPRYPTDIYVDPSNPYHALITYSGYNHVTPATPGHVFDVVFNPATGTATFTSLDGTGNGGARRPAGRDDRARRGEGRALHRHGLRSRQAGAPADGLDLGRARAADDDRPEPGHRPEGSA